jgi:hypothetical protein
MATILSPCQAYMARVTHQFARREVTETDATFGFSSPAALPAARAIGVAVKGRPQEKAACLRDRASPPRQVLWLPVMVLRLSAGPDFGFDQTDAPACFGWRQSVQKDGARGAGVWCPDTMGPVGGADLSG